MCHANLKTYSIGCYVQAAKRTQIPTPTKQPAPDKRLEVRIYYNAYSIHFYVSKCFFKKLFIWILCFRKEEQLHPCVI